MESILIVDDSKMSRMMLRAIISESYPDWNIIEAESDADALEKTTNTSEVANIILD